MKIILAKFDLTEEVLAMDKVVAEAVSRPSVADFNFGLDALSRLADPVVRCVIGGQEWEETLSRVRAKQRDFAPHFILRGMEIDLLLDVGVPETARFVFAAAKTAGVGILQCFEEEEQ